MANKIIRVSNSGSYGKSSLSNGEIYVDLDTMSVLNTNADEDKNGFSKYKTNKLTNVAAVQNSLHQIFSWIPGERIINPEFGSNLQKYLYDGITPQNVEAIVAEIKHSVSEWEPRVVIDKVVDVSDVNDTEHNTVRIDIVYHIIGLGEQQFRYSYTYYRHST